MASDKSWVDKSWTNADRGSNEYREGAIHFVEQAYIRVGQAGRLVCPCRKCQNDARLVEKNEVIKHIIDKGIMQPYGSGVWYRHGEAVT